MPLNSSRMINLANTLLLLLVLSISGVAESTAHSRAKKLTNGINVGSIGTNVKPECCETADQVKHLHGLGFTHVRLGVLLSSVCECKATGALQEAQVKQVLATIRTFTAQRMPVIVSLRLNDPHGSIEFDLQDGAFFDRLRNFWALFGARLKEFPDDLVFPEVLNEPYESPGNRDELKLITDWVRTQQPKLIAAIQSSSGGDKTVIATAARGSGLYGVAWLSLSTLHRDDVIYSFHYYNPGVFAAAGQGHYPSALRPPALPSIEAGDENAMRQELTDQNFVAEFAYWDKKRIDAEIDAVREWAEHNNVAVICDEFGVMKTADGTERSHWIKDVRSRLHKDGIGWTFWDYSDCRKELEPCAPTIVSAFSRAARVARKTKTLNRSSKPSVLGRDRSYFLP